MTRVRTQNILRGVLFADLFKLLVPSRSAVVGFLFEPSDHIFVLIRVNHHVISLLQNEEGERVGTLVTLRHCGL